jgi:DNA sulfur modification protein DndE
VFAGRREELKAEGDQLRKSVAEAEDNVRKRCEELLPIMLASGLCSALRSQLAAEREITRWQVYETTLRRYTLLGEWDDPFVDLLRERLAKDELADGVLEEQFRAHVNRGVISLFGLVKGIPDSLELGLRPNSTRGNVQ